MSSGAHQGDTPPAPLLVQPSEQVRAQGPHTSADTPNSAARHQGDRYRASRAHAAAESPAALDSEALTNRTQQAGNPLTLAIARQLTDRHRELMHKPSPQPERPPATSLGAALLELHLRRIEAER